MIRPFIKVLLVSVLLAVTAIIVVTNYVKARMADEAILRGPPRSYVQCVEINLPAIAKAKERWGIAGKTGFGATPAADALLPYLKGGRFPVCPSGGAYEIRPTGKRPKCSHPPHLTGAGRED